MVYVFEKLVVAGLLLIGIAVLWLLVGLFRSPKRIQWPMLMGLLGLAVVLTPMAYTHLSAIDLGDRERVVDGELHLTLTGWDKKSYQFLQFKPKTVRLYMANADVTDETLDFLQGMAMLKVLDLNDSQVSDTGLEKLHPLVSLEELRLRGTKVTNQGVEELLEQLPHLKRIDVRQTDVTQDILETWKAAVAGRRFMK